MIWLTPQRLRIVNHEAGMQFQCSVHRGSAVRKLGPSRRPDIGGLT
jgi:hypothetical protein